MRILIFLILFILVSIFLPKNELIKEAKADSYVPSGNKNLYVRVVLANFSNASFSGVTPGEMSSQMFYSYDSVRSFYNEESYGKVSITGDVYGWFNLPAKQSCDAESVFDQAVAAAGISVSSISGSSPVVVVAPFGPSYCGWVGYSSLSRNLIAVTTTNPNFVATIAHELGHTLGLAHASFYNCDNRMLFSIQNCIVEEYGDDYDVMGSGSVKMVHMDAVHKEFAGWFNSSNIQAVANSGQYFLESIENTSSKTKAIKINRGDGQYFYLEYRQPTGFDRNLDSQQIFGGVLIHLAPNHSSKSYLINPLSPSQATNPALPVGRFFSDPVSGITIAPAYQTNSGIYVDITFPSAQALTSYSLPSQFATGDLVSDQGTVYWIVGRNKIAFTSAGLFSSLGFSWGSVKNGDVSNYQEMEKLMVNTKNSRHPIGAWVKYGNTIYYSHESGLIPVPSWEVFLSNGGSLDKTFNANQTDVNLIKKSYNLKILESNDYRIYK